MNNPGLGGSRILAIPVNLPPAEIPHIALQPPPAFLVFFFVELPQNGRVGDVALADDAEVGA
jgi:hypothetical protein